MEQKVQNPLSPVPPVELAPLLNLSARLGSNPSLVQAGNGNTSIKLDGALWIKATGTWLAHATQTEMFLPVDLAASREALDINGEIPMNGAAARCLRPSTETPMHAVLRHNVVLHVHSVNCIAWAVRRDAQERLKERLDGLRWQWIPYVASGVPLAREVAARLIDAPKTNVWVLGNHGLVICGDSCKCAEALLQEVESRLFVAPRAAASFETALLAIAMRSSRWECPEQGLLHTLGTDPVSRRILKGGCLYPAQAIYLGDQIRTLPPSVPLSRFAEYASGRDGAESFVIVEGGGVILNKDIDAVEEATLIGLAQVLQRIEESAPLRYLTPCEMANLTTD